MTDAELPGPASLHGTPNFYRVMFFLCFILLVLLPFGLLSSNVCLESKEIQLNGHLSALGSSLESLRQQIAGDTESIASLEGEVLEIAEAEQVFSEEGDQGHIWGPDTRWSDMGRARVEELWRRRQILQEDLTHLQTLLREQTADLTIVQSEKERIAHFRTFVSDRKIALYAVILAGVFGSALFALLWGALVQGRVNGVLAVWAGK
ncbi:MAG: hypothetical protein JSW27_17280 [Phycisphaerales bacterium]|nr:MAG: hypothetical protein JSW27_17280 [Phycisphaerales bacterium]